MALMWMKKQAPWVICTFGILILVGLLWMDQSANTGDTRQNRVVGEVDGEEIPTDQFQMELQNYLRNEEMRTGKAPQGIQLIQFRQGLFDFKVQTILMERVFDRYQLHPSREEMMDYVVRNPREVAMFIQRFEGPEQLPPFLADSTIDQARYENWLAQDSIYDRIALRQMEEQLRRSTIPQIQLQQIMKSQVHPTALEEAFTVATRENKASLVYYHAPLDSFPVEKDRFKEEDLKAYYNANPDSFHFAEDAARLGYTRIPIRPSAADTALMLEFGNELKERAQGGESFEELATSYSNDPGSAEQGGKLGGFRTREGLDPAFAAAAFSMEPGQISDPVLSQFGYHVIKVNDRRGTDSADISHILLSITAGNETTDSLVEVADRIRAAAEDKGLEAAAKAEGFGYEVTPIFDRASMAPLGNYVNGFNSFAFSEHEKPAKISEALQGEEAVYVLEKKDFYAKGRSFERAKDRIADFLVRKEKLALAKKELEAQLTRIASAGDALPPSLGKAVLDSTASGPVSADGWLPGFGYSSPALFKVFRQETGSWGPVRETDQGAAVAKVKEKAFLSEAEIMSRVEATPPQNENFLLSSVVQEWTANLPKTAEVENKLDMVFRN
jgi:peptidyl-prolyl cis-trans isomerase D